MNRIFDPSEPIDVGEVDEAAPEIEVLRQAPKPPRRQRARRPPPQVTAPQGSPLEPVAAPTAPGAPLPVAPAPTAAGAAAPELGRRQALATLLPHPQPLVLVAAFGCAGLVTAAGGVVALSQWNRSQDSLQQERNLLLVERLRSLGPGIPTPVTPAAPILTAPVGSGPSALDAAPGGLAGGQVAGADLPPPPPQEPWIEQLGDLPQPQRSAPLLRVPVSAGLAAATAPSAPPRRSAPPGPLPLLVGVVGSPGKLGSAIFQMGGSTSTVGVGESIGSSGWRLRSTDGDSVLIDHDGDVRRITIGSGG